MHILDLTLRALSSYILITIYFIYKNQSKDKNKLLKYAFNTYFIHTYILK